ncbi:MAG: radical SAM protein [Gemmatimonadetes bacterium]|nr:radical SAM protein [Gemmatimonadota bacterium]MBT7421578.1 radical SAM protein [Gemmatimonadota bacterium]
MSLLTIDPQLEQRRESLATSLPLAFPISLNIESTNLCNLQCFFCPREESSKGIGSMDFELYCKIIDECAAHGPLKLINLHKDGEPLAHPRIYDMVRYIADRGAAEEFGFTSNGILFDEARAARLVEAGINKVSFSIDATSEDAYERAKGRRKYGIVVENVRRFLKSKPEHVKVAVKFISMKENQGEEGEFVEMWQDSGAELIISEYHDWSGSVRDSSLQGILPVSENACENPFYSLAVNWDGTVSICCVDWDSQSVVGDVHGQTIAEIWNGDALRQVREMHLSGRSCEVGACGGCSYKDKQSREYIGGWLMANRDRVMDY